MKQKIILYNGNVNSPQDHIDRHIVSSTEADGPIGSAIVTKAWIDLLGNMGLERNPFFRTILLEDDDNRIDFGSYSHFIQIKTIEND